MTVTFGILAPIMTLAALGLLVVRKAVHAALLLAVVMISLAVLYATLDAPFLFAVQIVVYTGAILMLFLFVLMLVGVDTSDELKETIAGQTLLAGVFGLVLGAVMVIAVLQASLGTMAGLADANAAGNVQGLADLLFSRYVLAFEVTAALLITAAMGAMVLAHRERFGDRPSQGDLAHQRLEGFKERGLRLTPLPPPGTYARHNANDTPALLPDGSTSKASVPSLLGGGEASPPAEPSPSVEPGHEVAGVETNTSPSVEPGHEGSERSGPGVETNTRRYGANSVGLDTDSFVPHESGSTSGSGSTTGGHESGSTTGGHESGSTSGREE